VVSYDPVALEYASDEPRSDCEFVAETMLYHCGETYFYASDELFNDEDFYVRNGYLYQIR